MHKAVCGVCPIWWLRERTNLSWDKPILPQFGKAKKKNCAHGPDANLWKDFLERDSAERSERPKERDELFKAWDLPAGGRGCHKNTQNFFFFFLFRAAHAAYGGSQARGWIGAVATGSYTATPDPSRIYELHHSWWQRPILNAQSKARDRNLILMVTSQIRFYWAMIGTPIFMNFLVSLDITASRCLQWNLLVT